MKKKIDNSHITVDYIYLMGDNTIDPFIGLRRKIETTLDMLCITGHSYMIAAKTDNILDDIFGCIMNRVDEPQNYKPKYEKIHNEMYEIIYLLIKGLVYDEIMNRLLYDDIIDCIVNHTIQPTSNLKILGKINPINKLMG